MTHTGDTLGSRRGGATLASPHVLLDLRGVSKRFGAAHALTDVDLDVAPGRVHALLGENGAGKSTLVKILGGVYRADEGEVRIEGKPVRFHAPFDSEHAGIAVVHQHRTLVGNLSVAENLVLGRMGPGASPFRRGWATERARALLADVGLDVEPSEIVERLSPAEQQTLEIARAVGREARVLILDEPTTSLTPPERQRLFAKVAELRDRGIAIIYISHDLSETLALADDVTVLRDGRLAGRLDGASATVDDVVRLMVGRAVAEAFPRRRTVGAEIVLRLEDVTSHHLEGVSLDVRRGELVCLAGLVGSGRTETLRAIFGLDDRTGGRVELHGKPLSIGSPSQAVRARMGFVPEDRTEQGVVLPMSVVHNIVLGNERAFRARGLLSRRREQRAGRRAIENLRVKVSSPQQAIAGLSGGNQQKVILGRWLAREVDLLLIDEPTVGIDVGARGEFYRLLDDFAAGGGAALIASSDLGEVLGLADRVVVLRAGRSVAELKGEEMDREQAMRAMAGAT